MMDRMKEISISFHAIFIVIMSVSIVGVGAGLTAPFFYSGNLLSGSLSNLNSLLMVMILCFSCAKAAAVIVVSGFDVV